MPQINENPLLTAIHENKSLNEINPLISNNINFVTANGLTPLHEAVKNKRVDVAECLLKNGANVNAASVLVGETPLLAACKTDNLEMVKLLIINGANANAAYITTDETPLFLAATNKYPAICEVLIKQGADIKVALDLAVSKGNDDATKFLLTKINSTDFIKHYPSWIKEANDSAQFVEDEMKENDEDYQESNNEFHCIVQLLTEHFSNIQTTERTSQTQESNKKPAPHIIKQEAAKPLAAIMLSKIDTPATKKPDPIPLNSKFQTFINNLGLLSSKYKNISCPAKTEFIGKSPKSR